LGFADFAEINGVNMRTSSILLKIGVASVAIPTLGFILGMILKLAIPGCQCDSGAGCHGCGSFNGLIALLILGGFVAALAALITVLPISLALAGIFGVFSKPATAALPIPKTVSPAEFTKALAHAFEQYRLGQPVTEICPACSTVISVISIVGNTNPARLRVNASCTCGGCSGSYNIQK
jgi:hypothetical protein